MVEIIIFSKARCPYCDRAKALLKQQDIPFREVRVDLEPNGLEEMQSLTTGRTFPQIIIGGAAIGGFDDLYRLYRGGELAKMLEG